MSTPDPVPGDVPAEPAPPAPTGEVQPEIVSELTRLMQAMREPGAMVYVVVGPSAPLPPDFTVVPGGELAKMGGHALVEQITGIVMHNAKLQEALGAAGAANRNLGKELERMRRRSGGKLARTLRKRARGG